MFQISWMEIEGKSKLMGKMNLAPFNSQKWKHSQFPIQRRSLGKIYT